MKRADSLRQSLRLIYVCCLVVYMAIREVVPLQFLIDSVYVSAAVFAGGFAEDRFAGVSAAAGDADGVVVLPPDGYEDALRKSEESVAAEVTLTDDGFVALFTMPFTVEVKDGMQLGFDMRYNDAAPDGVRRLVNFCDASDTGWNDPNVFGLLELSK